MAHSPKIRIKLENGHIIERLIPTTGITGIFSIPSGGTAIHFTDKEGNCCYEVKENILTVIDEILHTHCRRK